MYYGDGGYEKWKSGQYSESGVNNSSSGIWKNAYLGIRQVAIFLNNIDKNKEFTEEEITDFKGQGAFFEGILLLVDASCIWSSAYHSG